VSDYKFPYDLSDLPENLQIKSAQPLNLSNNVTNSLRVYSNYNNVINNKVIFQVDKFGDIWRDDKCITEDPSAILECFKEWVKLISGIEIRTIVKDGES
jgi:hypothetical protein